MLKDRTRNKCPKKLEVAPVTYKKRENTFT